MITSSQRLDHKSPRIYFDGRIHNPVLSSFMTYHWTLNDINGTGATNGAETAYPSGTSEFTFLVEFVS